MTPEAAASVLLADPSTTGLFCDFDGTLSNIVDDPTAARAVAGAPELLRSLSRMMARVGVVSGRPVSFLADQLGTTGLILVGLYGLESIRRGKRRDHPQAGAWREVIDDVASMSRAEGPDGMVTESKGLSLTLHYRLHPELADAVTAWAARQSARSGLEARPSRMAVELHPPVHVDKGSAVYELARGLGAVCFLGDDVGDLSGFDALDRLAQDGTTVVRIAVASTEAPRDLIDRADVVVDGPDQVMAFLRRLAPTAA